MEGSKTNQKKEQVPEVSEVDVNLRFYLKGCEVPADAIKPIKAGRLRGMSDVNPMWRMRRLTEIFGPVGFGWRYEITKQWTEEFVHSKTQTETLPMPGVRPTFNESGQQTTQGFSPVAGSETECCVKEVKCFCNINLYVRDPETKEWGAAIPGTGGSTIVAKESSGAYFNDEGYKMALTDALSIAMKAIGIGGNIWYGPKATGHNESKYEDGTQVQPQKRTNDDGMLAKAIAEIYAAKTMDEFSNIWAKWSNDAPAMCANGSDFYKVAENKAKALRKA